ncbi:CIC11C00000000417 [Sungouiella intermedia]|uniref:CIC11C00000000417 n=1 Tax=Sungouiella intermedia TaxID=45354 RepID=A0A1L0D696_9ASCO|nr:CIC11C00000000417 [[Candida] intermedia]
MIRNTTRLTGTRSFSAVSRRWSSKYKFYDLLLETATHPQEPIEALLMTSKELKELKKTTKTTFEGNYKLDDMTAEEKIARVFGGRIAGETRQSSSRMNVGEPRMIAGVEVPDKPGEPDNCCMSGCINCVWEMYNDDVKDWNRKRKEAAEKLVQKGGVWPADFHPPVQYLEKQNLPASLANLATEARKVEERESWGNVPVLIKVFAEMEKRMREKRKQQQRQQKQQRVEA